MFTDPIADFLTRVRNAIMARHRLVEAPHSNLKENISKVLLDKGYILDYRVVTNEKGHKVIKLALKYHPVTKNPAIVSISRISKPGLRKYIATNHMPRVLNGYGIAILSTSKGVISDKEARVLNVGGEVLCYVY